MPEISVHELLRYSQHGGHRCSIIWDLRNPPLTSVCHITSPDNQISEFELSQHATAPPVNTLHIICDILPEDWPIVAQNENGVTVGDVLVAIHSTLKAQIKQAEWDRLPQKKQTLIGTIFDERWRAADDPRLTWSYGVLRIDCILRHTRFAGLSMAVGSPDSCIMTLLRPSPS